MKKSRGASISFAYSHTYTHIQLLLAHKYECMNERSVSIDVVISPHVVTFKVMN